MNNTLIGLCTYNHYGFTYLCLESLWRNTPKLRDGSVRLAIIDNNSTDGTIDKIKKDFPWVTDIRISDKDCITYQWNQFLDLLGDNEDFLMIPNDVVFGPNWLELLQEDTYRYDNVICGSPYLPVDLQYDEIINEDWANKYYQVYQDIRKADYSELAHYLDGLYDGDFDKFCLDFQERNKNEPPLDSCVTHVMLFKNKLFKEHGFRFSEEYCPYYGSHEFDTNCRLNNLGYFRIASSRSYVHHWISISNQTATNSTLSDKQKAIDANNKHLLEKWEWIPGSTVFANFPAPSRIQNWRTPYHKWRLKEYPSDNTQPGIKFMTFEGLMPGHNYFDGIQPGSIVSNKSKSHRVHTKNNNVLELEFAHRMVSTLSINEKQFKEESWNIDYYWRKEEEQYHGYGHMQFLLENK